MSQIIDIIRVSVGCEWLRATVRVADGAPLMTSEDLEGTTRVYNLMPTIINHACVGDHGDTFRDCMGDTEICHLLEHMVVELVSRTRIAPEIVSGRTWRELAYERTYTIQLPCPDDVLVVGALSSACWILDWAFGGGVGAVPDVEATVAGLEQLARSLPVEGQASKAAPAADTFRFDDGWDDREVAVAQDADRPRTSRKII